MQAMDIRFLNKSKLLDTPNLNIGTAVSLFSDVTLVGLLLPCFLFGLKEPFPCSLLDGFFTVESELVIFHDDSFSKTKRFA